MGSASVRRHRDRVSWSSITRQGTVPHDNEGHSLICLNPGHTPCSSLFVFFLLAPDSLSNSTAISIDRSTCKGCCRYERTAFCHNIHDSSTCAGTSARQSYSINYLSRMFRLLSMTCARLAISCRCFNKAREKSVGNYWITCKTLVCICQLHAVPGLAKSYRAYHANVFIG